MRFTSVVTFLPLKPLRGGRPADGGRLLDPGAVQVGPAGAPAGGAPLHAPLAAWPLDRERALGCSEPPEKDVLPDLDEREVGDDHEREHSEEVERERGEAEQPEASEPSRLAIRPRIQAESAGR
jgi:hypothetical protein